MYENGIAATYVIARSLRRSNLAKAMQIATPVPDSQ